MRYQNAGAMQLGGTVAYARSLNVNYLILKPAGECSQTHFVAQFAGKLEAGCQPNQEQRAHWRACCLTHFASKDPHRIQAGCGRICYNGYVRKGQAKCTSTS